MLSFQFDGGYAGGTVLSRFTVLDSTGAAAVVAVSTGLATVAESVRRRLRRGAGAAAGFSAAVVSATAVVSLLPMSPPAQLLNDEA